MRWAIRMLGLLAVILAGIVWWMSDDSSMDRGLSNSGGHAVPSKPVGTSTLSHGSLPPPPPSAGQPSADPDHR